MTLTVISLGAGVQSTTMALMAARGEIEPMPDCAIFADTQAEPKSVYDHLEWLTPKLPFPVHTVTRGNLAEDGLTLRVSKKTVRRVQKNLIPLFVLNPDGTKGMLQRKCTADYKVSPIMKKVRELVGPQNIRSWRKRKDGQPIVEQWIGISADEKIRMKDAPEKWTKNRWPLIEKDMSRHHCLAWMADNGYPTPPRSACVFCPYHNDNEWRRLRDKEPTEFARAVEWERRALAANSKDEMAKGKMFLHRQCVPLDEVDLSTLADHGQVEFGFLQECEGMCGV